MTTVSTDISGAYTASEKPSLAARFVDWLENRSHGARCAAFAAKLNELSDADLKKLGIKSRSEIVPFAFRGYMY